MNQLFLQDLAGKSDEQVRQHLVNEYDAKSEEVEKYDILLAYESVGAWGCDSSSFFLLRRRDDGRLYETRGSHCSYYGFEGQFSPEEANAEYLKSDNFYFSAGSYDSNRSENEEAVREFIRSLA